MLSLEFVKEDQAGNWQSKMVKSIRFLSLFIHLLLCLGWEPGKNLFSVENAADRGTVIMNLLSDAGQKVLYKL